MSAPLHLFEATGIEIEYAIVDRDTLDVQPVADRLLARAAAEAASEHAEVEQPSSDEIPSDEIPSDEIPSDETPSDETPSDVERGEIAWSNELVLHVLELKTNGPAARIDGALLDAFRREVAHADALLGPLGARLMPGAMHPWIDPARETRIWPHENTEIYRTYDRVFGCKGHGWSNLQSLHLNLPFADDEEFGRLHAAIRILLPILPALAASSPVEEGRIAPSLDQRMEHYARNQARIPSIAGAIVPEAIFDRRGYERDILERVARDFAPHDPDGVLSQEYVNSRGAIARFSRGSIEIRILDSQESPSADLALAALVRGTLTLLVDGQWSSFEQQRAWPTDRLAALYRRTVRDAERVTIDDRDYLECFGLRRRAGSSEAVSCGDLWRHLADAVFETRRADSLWAPVVDEILHLGPLARRLRRALGVDHRTGRAGGDDGAIDRETLRSVYHELCECLRTDRLFGRS